MESQGFQRRNIRSHQEIFYFMSLKKSKNNYFYRHPPPTQIHMLTNAYTHGGSLRCALVNELVVDGVVLKFSLAGKPLHNRSCPIILTHTYIYIYIYEFKKTYVPCLLDKINFRETWVQSQVTSYQRR